MKRSARTFGIVKLARLALLLAAGALLVAPAALSAEVGWIRFDDLPPGTLVTNQYEAEGVVFSAG